MTTWTLRSPGGFEETLTATDMNDFLVHNEDDAEAIEALEPGETYCGGGGAFAEWSITRNFDSETRYL